MITYKISKTHSYWRERCDSRYNCWSHQTKRIIVETRIKCSCCSSKYHKRTYHLCDKHIQDPDKFLPPSLDIHIKRSYLLDPISKLF
jgi:hypothetical protein